MRRIRSSCSATQTKAPTSPTRRVPTVWVNAKSAMGGESAGPKTACRANGRWRAESHSDWDAIRYRRPATWRSKMLILSSISCSQAAVKLKARTEGVGVLPASPLGHQKCESRARERHARGCDLCRQLLELLPQYH